MDTTGKRAMFYSTKDLALWFYFDRIKEVIETPGDYSEVNNVIELYCICRIYEVTGCNPAWDDELNTKYSKLAEEAPKIIGRFFNQC